jgi:hypothetical protein
LLTKAAQQSKKTTQMAKTTAERVKAWRERNPAIAREMGKMCMQRHRASKRSKAVRAALKVLANASKGENNGVKG